ncbi:MAG: hypothetical protein KDK37_14430 [Leptospiraceae bacterium]|nr:hypothetical protein [Leptospiraceae bacterium]MCB1305479.1 hypothetical protein [Leptospiraceae bacterium]
MANQPNKPLGIFVVVLAILLSNCGTSPDRVRSDAELALSEADALLSSGNRNEAYQLYYQLSLLYPDSARIKQKLAESRTEDNSKAQNDLRGSSLSKRKAVSRSILLRILLYIPDRIADIFDTFSFGIGTGFGVGAGAWVTKAAQVDLMAGSQGQFGWFHKRQAGFQVKDELSATIGPVGASWMDGVKGAGPNRDEIESLTYLHSPRDENYQNFGDYWSTGVHALVPGLSISAEFHFFEVLDLIAGFFFFDLSNDDWATTESLDLNTEQARLLRLLEKYAGSMSEEQVRELAKMYPLRGAEK